MIFTCLFEGYLRTLSGDYLQLAYSVIVRYSAEARDVFPFSKASRIIQYAVGREGSFLGAKRPGHEADHSPPNQGQGQETV